MLPWNINFIILANQNNIIFIVTSTIYPAESLDWLPKPAIKILKSITILSRPQYVPAESLDWLPKPAISGLIPKEI